MKKTTTAVLLIAMLAACASCGESGTAVETTAGTDTTVPAVEETTESIAPKFEPKDFGGVDFNIVSTVSGYDEGDNWFIAEEENGDTLNDAVYKRNVIVEETLNVNLTYEQIVQLNMAQPLLEAAMAGDDCYHLALTHQMNGLSTMVVENLLIDFQKIPYIDFSKPYWNQSCNEAMEIGGHQYYAVSEFMKVNTYGIYFNKRLIEEFKLESPYDLVWSGDWTLDKMMEMANGVAKDLNGDTTMDYQDQYGFSSLQDYWISMFIWGSDIRLCAPDTLELTLMSERTITLFEKLYTLIHESGSSYMWTFDTHTSKPEQKMLITSGRVLFTPNSIGTMVNYRDSDVDFGIVPMPKFDKAQEDYAGVNWNGMMCVPITVQDTEMVGMVTELLSYHSGEIVRPAYYDTLLGTKLVRDEEMRDMIAFMFDHIVYDAGMSYFGQAGAMQDMYYAPMRLIGEQKSKDFASYYAARVDACNSQIADFLNAIK